MADSWSKATKLKNSGATAGFLKHQHEHGYQGIKKLLLWRHLFLLEIPMTCINQSVLSYHSYSLDCAGWLSTFSSQHLCRLHLSSHELQARAANGCQDFSAVLRGCTFFGLREHALPSTCKWLYLCELLYFICIERERDKEIFQNNPKRIYIITPYKHVPT